MKKLYEKAKKLVENHPWILLIVLGIWACFSLSTVFWLHGGYFEIAMIASFLCFFTCTACISQIIGLITKDPRLIQGYIKKDEYFKIKAWKEWIWADVDERIRRGTVVAAVTLLINAGVFIIQLISFITVGIIFLISLI